MRDPDATQPLPRTWVRLTRQRLSAGSDVVADEPAPDPLPRSWGWSTLRGTSHAYAIRTLWFTVAFLVVSGPSGMRTTIWTWVRHDSTQATDLAGHLLRALLVGAAAAVASVVAASIPQRGKGSGRGAGRWTRYRAWSWLLGLALALGCAAQSRIADDSVEAAWPAVMALLGLVAVGPAVALWLTQVGITDPARPRPRRWLWLGILIGVAALGWVSQRIGPETAALLGLVLGAAALAWVSTRAGGADGLRHMPSRSMWMGLLIGAAALLLRLVPPLLGGDIRSGAVGPFALGELTRAMAALSAALALTGVRQQLEEAALGRLAVRTVAVALVGRLLPALGMIAVLMATEDLGPALILLATIAALTLLAYNRALWWRATTVAIGAGLAAGVAGWAINAAVPSGVGFIEHAEEVLSDRFAEGGCASGQRSQVCKSLRILHDAGLLPPLREFGSGLPAGSTLVRHLEVARSDYAITMLSGWVGMGLVVVLLAAILATSQRLFLRALDIPGAGEIAQLRTRIAAVAGLQLMLPTVLLGLAILLPRFPWTSAKWPLTGLDVPFIAANGVSTLVYSTWLAVGALIVLSMDRRPIGSPPTTGNRMAASRVVSVGVPAVLVVLSAGAVWIHAGWAAAGSVPLQGEAFLRDNHTRILSRDGEPISEPNSERSDPNRALAARLYPDPGLAVDLGFFRPVRSGNEAVGLEWLAAPLLTCGDHRTRGALSLQARCSGADVIATIDARAQRSAAQSAVRSAPPGARADVVLVERRTGAITALASSDSNDPQMQEVISQASRTDGWRPPTLLAKRDLRERRYDPFDPDSVPAEQWAGTRSAFAMRHLSEQHYQCVTPAATLDDSGEQALDERGDPLPPRLANPRRPGEPWSKDWPDDLGPSRQQCQADKQGLALMRAWSDRRQPGSTFKVVTALAALSADAPMPPPSLTTPLTEVGGLRLQGQIVERDALTACGKQTLDWMLLQSCNTTAAWLGIRSGWPALVGAASQLGFGGAADGAAVVAPADPADPAKARGSVRYGVAQMGSDPSDRLAEQADGVVRPLTPGAAAHAVGNAAIGQDQVRASIMDMAAVTHAIVGAGPLESGGAPPRTGQQVDTDYEPAPVLNMVAGSCTRQGTFQPVDYPLREQQADDADLALVRRGMWWAVHSDAGTAKRLRPGAGDGSDRALEDLDVVWAKTGSADLGPTSAGAELWARWVIGATDRYVFVARVTGYPSGGGANPAVTLIQDLFAEMRDDSPPPPLDEVCRVAAR